MIPINPSNGPPDISTSCPAVVRARFDHPVGVGLLLQKIDNTFVDGNRLVAEADDFLTPNVHTMRWIRSAYERERKYNLGKGNDSLFLFVYHRQRQPGEKGLHTFQTEMKLCLVLFMRVAVNDVPISLQVLHDFVRSTSLEEQAVCHYQGPRLMLRINQ